MLAFCTADEQDPRAGEVRAEVSPVNLVDNQHVMTPEVSMVLGMCTAWHKHVTSMSQACQKQAHNIMSQAGPLYNALI